MPNCFQLFPIGSDEPAILQVVDDRIWREVYEMEPDPEQWCYSWRGSIGFLLACTGLALTDPALQEKIAKWATPLVTEAHKDYATEVLECARENAELLKILNWLKEHYTSNAWVQIGR